ncbi:MAG: DUF4258 domain-containing protein [Anaerolineales bacterium]|nr:DUF4258 domain-containing protein [Anaerolineales bacterium]
MSQTFKQIQELIACGKIRISAHGYDELAEDNIYVKDVVASVEYGLGIEDYPDFPKGPCACITKRYH